MVEKKVDLKCVVLTIIVNFRSLKSEKPLIICLGII